MDNRDREIKEDGSKDNQLSKQAIYGGGNHELTERWISGIPYEVAFWRSYYRNKKSRAALMSWSQLGKECELDHFDLKTYIEGLDKQEPIIADVGCALSYVFSNIIGGKEYQVTYIDPLAPFYNKILDDYSLPYPQITFGMGEMLSHNFLPGSVSFLHIRNALDHSIYPMVVIWQALVSLHVGGVLYLNHKPNEAEHEAYVGFHQYNIDCQEGKLVIWNKENRIDVERELSGYADVETSVTEEGRIVAVIRKIADIPDDHTSLRDGDAYSLGVMQTLMGYFHSPSNVLRYQFRRGFLTAGHALMRLLPHKTVRKIKEIISGKKSVVR